MLEQFNEIAYRAYSGTSFSPERRAKDTINSYSAELASDIATLREMGASEEQVKRYKEKYESKFSSWLGSRGRIVSPMIAGPSNFPSARMRKYNNWEQNKYNEFQAWREKVMNAYRRYEKRRKIEEAGGEIEVAKQKLARLEELQEYMKKINAAHRAFLKNPKSLEKAELTESEKETIRNYVPTYSWIKHPYAPYQLTNNNAKIKQTRERIAILEAKEVKAEAGNKEVSFEGGKILMNYEIDRLQILFNEKPSYEKIKELKSRGFRWSPFYKAWQRQITAMAKCAAAAVTGIESKNL